MLASLKRGALRKNIYSTPRFDVVRCVVRVPHGSTGIYYYVRKPSAVAVVAFPLPGKVILLKQKRPSINANLLELPGGRIEHDETPKAAAKRELLEETGYVSESCNFICKFAPLPSVCDEILFVFCATRLVQQKALINRIDIDEQYTIPISSALKKAFSNEMSASDALALLRCARSKKLI